MLKGKGEVSRVFSELRAVACGRGRKGRGVEGVDRACTQKDEGRNVGDVPSVHDRLKDYGTALYHTRDIVPSPLHKSIDPPPSQHADKDAYDSDSEEL